MASVLSSSLLKSFAKVTNDSSASTGQYAYGKVVESGGNKYVVLDGSTALTSISVATDAEEGDRIMVYVSNHTASVVGNITCPSSGRKATDVSQMVYDYESVVAGELDAVYGNINYIYANYVSTDTLVTNEALIEYLSTNYATITNLTAVYESVKILDADVANITDLLSGNIGTGTLEAIHITGDNVVIDDAVINSAMIASISADKITAGTIYTDLVKIANNTGENLLIDGSTIQITDANYICRVQIGEDASGDYNMYLWDDSGNLLWNARGLTEAGVSGNGGIIKDSAVADDASISGYKLDITSVAECLNEDGSITVSGSQVIVNDTTLSAWYSDITTKIGNVLDGMDLGGLLYITVYYALGSSDEEPPSIPEDGDEIWSTEWTTAGDLEYLWTAYRLEYMDGSVAWTTPMCLTDGYTRTQTSSLQTQLEAVQGSITAKVWQTDIDESVSGFAESITTLSDQYAQLLVDVGGVSTTVESLQTEIADTYSTLYDQISELTVSTEGISASVTLLESNLSGVQTELEAKITEIAGSISLEVSDAALGSTAGIVISVNGEVTSSAELDLTGVREAFANDPSEITISAGTVTFDAGSLIINSTNCLLEAEGNLTAHNATLYGKLTSTSSDGVLQCLVSSGRVVFLYDGVEYGGMYSTYSTADSSVRGAALVAMEAASYLSFGHSTDDSSASFSIDYRINYNADAFNLTQRHVFYNGIYSSGELYVDGTLTVEGYGNFDSRLYCSGTAYFNSTLNCYDRVLISGTGASPQILVSNGTKSSATSVRVLSTWVATDMGISLMIGADGYKRGLHDLYYDEWVFYIDASGDYHCNGTESVGSETDLVYVKNGVLTDSYADVGEDCIPIYMSVGGFEECTEIYLPVYNYDGSSRYPVGSTTTNGNRVSVIRSKSGGIAVYGQWGTSNASYTGYTISLDSSSDVRLKDNIMDTDVEAMPIIRQMLMRQFDRKDLGIHQAIGMVADELEILDSNLTTGGGYDEDGLMDIKTICTTNLVCYLVKGIQEIDATISTALTKMELMQIQLEDLQNEVTDLRSENEELRSQVLSLQC